jgi:hypothetical protein
MLNLCYTYSVALVRKQTILTERPPLVGEVSAKLIKSYFTNRIQQVKDTHVASNQLKEYLSSSLPVRYIVPQDFVVGPLLL